MAGQIRAVTLADAAAIQAIYAPYVTDTVISFETTPPSVEDMAARILKATGKYPWLVYVTGEQQGSDPQPSITGYAYASPHRERAAYQWSVDVSVYVSPAYHRRSIGRGLYTALFALLRAQGFINAYAGIALPNEGSVGIHTALGFEPVGIYQQVGYKLGRWHDVGWWGLRLTGPTIESTAEPLPPKPISDLMDTPVWSTAMQQGLALIRA
jgi:phosphinothricin acetyltransferase